MFACAAEGSIYKDILYKNDKFDIEQTFNTQFVTVVSERELIGAVSSRLAGAWTSDRPLTTVNRWSGRSRGRSVPRDRQKYTID